MSLGFSQAGFEILYAFDNDGRNLETYSRNFPLTLTETTDIEEVSRKSIRANLRRSGRTTTEGKPADLALDNLDILIGGPPCQGFSNQNNSSDNDARNLLVLEFFRLVEELQPRFFLIENVRGLAGRKGKTILKMIRQRSSNAGYKTAWSVLNAFDFGVAQARKRLFIFGAKGSVTNPDFLAHFLKNPSNGVTHTTVRDAISDLANEDSVPEVKNNVHANLSPINKERLEHLLPGQGRNSLPNHLKIPAQNRNVSNGHHDTYGRLDWDRPAPTLTTAFQHISKGRFGHPEQSRGITLREGARLQGFPDEFVFLGNTTTIARQIGNSVCPPVAKSIAGRLLEQMDVLLVSSERSLTIWGEKFRFGRIEYSVLEYLYHHKYSWVEIKYISLDMDSCVQVIRLALARIARKLASRGLDPNLLLERRRGGFVRLTG